MAKVKARVLVGFSDDRQFHVEAECLPGLTPLSSRRGQPRPTEPIAESVGVRGLCKAEPHIELAAVPARYCTGYLGDMGAPPPYGPMDFAAWFEAYLGGRWYTFDPRNNVPRIGRVLVARGRDAIDVAITTTFGPNTLGRFKVWTDEVTSA